MQFVKPSLIILKRFYSDTANNLKMILSRELDKISDPNQRQAVTRTVYEVVRHHRLLDYIIRKYSQRKLKKIQPDIRLLLKIGAYLLIFSQSYPDYAVVNEIVNAVNPRAKGFTNALLRNIAADKAFLREEVEHIPEPGITYSISDELLEHIKHLSPNLEENLSYLSQEPRFHIRLNPKLTNWTEAKQHLLDHNITFKELEKFQSFEIKETGQVIDGLLKEQRFYFQDTGSQLISIIAARYAQTNVLDCCAAPGTKSVTLSLLNPTLKIYANDINPKRAILMKRFLDQYGLTEVRSLVSDIKAAPIRGTFDFIIVDAPCTSSGTLRKNPDLKIKIDNNLIRRNAANQYEIMESLATRYPESGYMLYSVCSFIREESDAVLEKWLNNPFLPHPYERVELERLLEEFGFAYKKGEHGYYLLPSDTLQNDLFYVSLLKRL